MDNGFAEGYAVGQGNANNNGWGNAWGGDWIWVILLLALFNGGWGFGGGYGGGGNLNYELGKVATSNDVAVGFAQNATLSSLNDLKLGQAGIQQTLCQGFSGVNASIMQAQNGIQNAICQLGYEQQNCCCQTQRAIDGVNYNLAKNTCDITNAIHTSTRERRLTVRKMKTPSRGMSRFVVVLFAKRKRHTKSKKSRGDICIVRITRQCGYRSQFVSCVMLPLPMFLGMFMKTKHIQ